MTQRQPVVRVKIIDADTHRRAIEAVSRCDPDTPMEVIVRRWEGRRTLSMNALWWQWMDAMAKHYSAKAGPFTKDDMHILMKHRFLGYTDSRTLGRTEIPPQLRSTANLTKGEMLDLMQRVDAWAADNGCLLPRPGDSEYDQLARRQEF